MKKIPFLIIFLLGACFLRAQDKTSFSFAIDHVALSVKDLDRSAGFYKNVLNLAEITNRSKLDGVRWFSLSEGKELHLISFVKKNVTLNKAVHFALTTPSFDVFVKKLDQLNITYYDWPGTVHTINIRADGTKQIFFQDPDNYWVEINSAGQK